MSSTTVAEFASELKKSSDTVLEQLKSAGVAKSAASDKLTDADKQRLLGYLQASHGTASAERKKITLVKKSTSEIKQADSSGKARTIQVEVRKKRTFVRRDDGVEVAAEPEHAAQAVETASLLDNVELARREDEARRQAELIRRQEEELSQKIPFYSQRWSVSPGATGWAQVQRGYCVSLEDNIEKLSYDLFYIKNMSVGLDFLIVFQTIKILLLGRGAR